MRVLSAREKTILTRMVNKHYPQIAAETHSLKVTIPTCVHQQILSNHDYGLRRE